MVVGQERTINLGDFDIVKVFNGMTLELVKSEQQKIVITGEKKENVTVKNTNGKLKVFLNFPEVYDQENVRITLYYKDVINVLDVNEGAAIYSDEVFKQNNLSVRSQEGAYIHLVLDVKNLSVKTVSGASIRLRGTVVNQEIEATTGGVYESYELMAEQTEVTAASGARVEVNATALLDAKVRFGGKIYYKGNPEKVITKKIFGGSILNKG
tara:strand:+ start:295051 stop:295683 length:633 start_codon:yes stop_codon:yes gene_type:complete